MARIRTLKPEFFQDEDLASLPPLDRLAFQGLWCYADREGRMEDRPGRLKVQILPFDDVCMEATLERLAAKGLIVRYAVDGKSYLAIPGFPKHQRPHPREPASDLPVPSRENTRPSRENTRLSSQEDESANCAVNIESRENTRPAVKRFDGARRKEIWEGDLGRRSGKGTEGTPLSTTRESPSADADGARVFVPEDLRSLWNAHAPPLPTCLSLTAPRLKAARSRLHEHPDAAYWQEVLVHLVASPFCLGQSERGWRASFDWLLRPDSATKVLEGKYDQVVRLTSPKTAGNSAAVEEWLRTAGAQSS